MSVNLSNKFDVVGVDVSSLEVRVLAEGKLAASAEGIVSMAVMNLGVEEEFFADVPAGKYKDGDTWIDE